MRTNEDITVYNRYRNADRIYAWHKTLVTKVHFEEGIGLNQLLAVQTKDNKGTVYIPKYIDRAAKYIDGDEFLKLSNKEGYFTLRAGDMLCRGQGEEVVGDNIGAIKGLLEIQNVNNMDFGSKSMQHWEVAIK